MNSFKATIIGITALGLCASGYSAVIWSDEFDGTKIDSSTWTYDVGGGGFGNGQLEHNTARSENSYIENGNLVIEARREDYSGNAFTSARMLTQGRFAFKYGTLEARIQLPDTADGLWPAFWLLGNNFPGINWPGCGEIDIVEMGAVAGIQNGTQNELINCAIHFSDAADATASQVQWINASDYIATNDLSAGFHRYKVEWTPTTLSFFLDDVQYASWDITADYFSEFHQPHFPIINLAIGGWNYVQINDPALITATFPAKMKVDWIRLEDNAYTEVYLGEDAEESGNFGIFTETTPVDAALVFGNDASSDWPYSDEAALYTWNNMVSVAPGSVSEGSEAWAFDIAAGDWFGMGVFLPNFRNMKNYSDGTLHFDVKTTSSETFRVGIMSSRAGDSYLPVGDQSTEFGFARDGNWHTVSIPLNRYGNIDFNTVHQMFIVVGDAPGSAMNLSFDNVWWEPSVVRAKPVNGSFGVFTETEEHKDAGEFGLGIDGDFFVWADTLEAMTEDPYEGSSSISLKSAAGLTWFGAAFTPNVKHDLSAFDNPNGKLNFAIKTSSSTTFQVGLKSGNMDGVGQKWITFENGSDPYGFRRDGQWHEVEIPVSDLNADVDFSQLSQLFQILGTDGPITDIELDDIHFSGGMASQTNVAVAVVESGVGISWPTSSGKDYAVQWTDALGTNSVWNDLGADVQGDSSVKTLFDPTGTSTMKFYRIIERP